MTSPLATTDLHIPVGAPVWMDLVSSDVEASVAFYTQLLGWTCEEAGSPEGYRYLLHRGRAVGGVMANDPGWGMPDAWSVFLRTDDAAATAAAATAHGGTVLMEPCEVAPNGTFTILRDAGGAVVSAWQPGTEPGFGALMEAGAPTHFELHTRDFDATHAFYRGVFGWEDHVTDLPGFRYATYGAQGGDPAAVRAGIMDDAADAGMPEEPAHWAVYLGCDDARAVVERAASLGAEVLMPPEATPYGVLAVLRDPAGVEVRLQA
ncbi:VOC family protein [Nocardioides marmoribigeumensis]|uniref:Enzyme related to lactoylglutathione lyase n=1 Tax=Nocardioides marmoribigeumensis TaxID=433649 RepID=A0ABU2BQZ7_9ACTN|nr:VOC family protein [Nocardioides marmoribigeumensis]MDR7361051.1 putative enzyme related to lactoylglutathione lyase [Nocardioides marmoribigeumensis]